MMTAKRIRCSGCHKRILASEPDLVLRKDGSEKVRHYHERCFLFGPAACDQRSRALVHDAPLHRCGSELMAYEGEKMTTTIDEQVEAAKEEAKREALAELEREMDAAVSEFTARGGIPFGIKPRALWGALKRAGISHADEGRADTTARIRGGTKRVVQVPRGSVLGGGHDES